MNNPRIQTAWMDSPVGVITLMFDTDPLLIRRVLLPGELLSPEDRDRVKDDGMAPVPEDLARIVIGCLNGERREPPWGLMSQEGVTPLQQAVYAATAAIPYGCLATYKEIAARVHRPRACRFVGTALARNPFPILVPCHRVIRSDGGLGGFGGGPALKQHLIEFEAQRVGLHPRPQP